ncbi:DUF4230 domain-containing protein [Streptococcus sp. DD10]|uniref:DUF4230 domain-containing protein n=1 Tax=Streptococcus sp. DD10 TaxID=1777878 RepID=UPI001E4D93EE|nr:DUF4230 domain-containing protein [Streptococcus sp. DD10]
MKRILAAKIYIWVVLVFGLAILMSNWMGFFRGSHVTNQTTVTYSVVTKLEQVNELVFLNAGIRDVKTIKNDFKLPGTNFTVPMTSKKAIIILNYIAKFGIKQAPRVIELREHEYQVEIPKYQVIGFDLVKKDPYVLYDQRGELFSHSTQNVDTGKEALEALSAKDKEKYLKEYKDMITESAENYFTTFIKSLDSEAKIRFINAN